MFTSCDSDTGSSASDKSAGEHGDSLEIVTSVSQAGGADPAGSPLMNHDGSSTADIQMLLSLYDAENHFALVEQLSADSMQGREAGSPGAAAAASVIEGYFRSLGLNPWREVGLDTFRQHFSLEGIFDDNVLAVMPGSEPGSGYVILAAHYDHLGVSLYGPVFNGADDNAAGVGAVMEIARLLAESGFRPARDIVFCAFSGEESGQIGSQALAEVISANGLSGSVEMINIDGIGATGGSYLGVWDEGSDEAAMLVEAFRQAATLTVTTLVEEGTDIGSDAQPFVWQYGIPAVTVDWDWGSDPSKNHPYYHTVDDDAVHINRSVMAAATRTIIAALWLSANE